MKENTCIPTGAAPTLRRLRPRDAFFLPGKETLIARGRDPSDLSRYVRYAHVGVQFGLIVVLGILGGSWLDGKIGAGGAFTLIGTFLGAGIGFYVLYRETQRSRGPHPDDADPGDRGARGNRRGPGGPPGGE